MELAKQLVGTEEKPIDKHPDVVHGHPTKKFIELVRCKMKLHKVQN